MICIFTSNGAPCYILAQCIQAIYPMKINANVAIKSIGAGAQQSLLVCDEPLDRVIVEESPEEAVAIWYSALSDFEIGFEIEQGETEADDRS